MKKGIILTGVVFIIAILAVSMASAMTINVKTIPGHKVSLFVLNPDVVYELFKAYHVTADPFGKVSVVYPGVQTKVKINAKVMRDDQQILFEKLGEFPTNEDLYLQLKPNEISLDYRTPEELEAAANPTPASDNAADSDATEGDAENVAVTVEQTEEESAGGSVISGYVVSIKEKILENKTIIYYALGLIVLGALALFTASKLKNGLSMKRDEDVKIIKSLNKQEIKKLSEAEKKIKEAQNEIDAIKNKDKRIQEAKKRYEEAKREIQKLGVDEDEENEEDTNVGKNAKTKGNPNVGNIRDVDELGLDED